MRDIPPFHVPSFVLPVRREKVAKGRTTFTFVNVSIPPIY
jgi:hypothetical protein